MTSLEVSIVLPFRDHEHLIGNVVRHIASALGELNRSFEVIAVDQGSGDNSHALLALMKQEFPTLSMIAGKGFTEGSKVAKGQVLILLGPETMAFEPSALGPVIEKLMGTELDMYLMAEHMLMCKRESSLEVIAKGFTKKQGSESSILNRAKLAGLMTDSYLPHNSSDSGIMRLISDLKARSLGSSRKAS